MFGNVDVIDRIDPQNLRIPHHAEREVSDLSGNEVSLGIGVSSRRDGRDSTSIPHRRDLSEVDAPRTDRNSASSGICELIFGA
jgi:hypothetical protein